MSKTVNTVLTIAIILSIAILLTYGYCAIQKLDESKEDNVVSTISKHINYREDAPVDFENSIEPEDDGVYEDEDFEEYIEKEEEVIEEEPDTDFVDPIVETPIDKPLAPFLVIAGSYKDKTNAETKVKQYQGMGISAEIVQLNNSKLHAICIARSGTEQEANDTMSTLKANHKIKAYVYKIP